MNALELIEQNLDVERILEHYEFEGVQPGTRFSRACCKVHNGKNPNNFVINNENGLWTCHSQCGSGSIYQLVQQIEECSFKEAMSKIVEILKLSLDGIDMNVTEEDYLKEMKKWKQTVKKIGKKSDITEYEIGVELRNVKKYRKFQESTLRHFELQYLESITLPSDKGGFYKLEKRLALPIYANQKKVGYALRKTREQDFPKWSNQPKGLPTKDMLYNYDAMIGQDEFVICEGFFDVWAFYEIGINAVSTFGAHLTDEQYKHILRSGCTKVTLAYDGDDAGREATEKAIQKLRGKVDVYKVFFQEGEDAESIGSRALYEIFQQRRRVA